jgi:hypothetical protein
MTTPDSESYEPLPREENHLRALEMLQSLEYADLADIEELEGVDEGPCQECGRSFARARVVYGVFVLCRVCARRRAQVKKAA